MGKLVACTIYIRHQQSFAEYFNGCHVVKRVKLKLSAIVIYLFPGFTYQYVDSAFSPRNGIFVFRKEYGGIKYLLRFEQEMISGIGIIMKDMIGVFVIIHQEFRKKLRCKRYGILKKHELLCLVFQAGAHFQRTPCKTCILRICSDFSGAGQLKLFLCNGYQWIFLHPVHILERPFCSIFLIFSYIIHLSHRNKPFLAMKLPAELIIFYRPVSPINIFSVIKRGLISFMGI